MKKKYFKIVVYFLLISCYGHHGVLGLTEEDFFQNPFIKNYATYTGYYTKTIVLESKFYNRAYIFSKETGRCFYIRIFKNSGSDDQILQNLFDHHLARQWHINFKDLKEISAYDTPMLKIFGKEEIDQASDDTQYYGLYSEKNQLTAIAERRSNYIGFIDNSGNSYENHLKETVLAVNELEKLINPSLDNKIIGVIFSITLLIIVLLLVLKRRRRLAE